MRACKWWVTTCLLVFGALVQAASAQGRGDWSRIVSSAETEAREGPDVGLCFDVPHGTTLPGTLVDLHACHDGANQKFRLKEPGETWSRIAVYEGANERCLAYRDSNGWTRIQIDRCEGAPLWGRFGPFLRPDPMPEACMGVHPLYGFLVVDRDCWPGDWYRFGSNWNMAEQRQVGPPRPIVSDQDPRRCLDVSGGSRSPGASLLHYACSGAPWQAFQLFAPGGFFSDKVVMLGVYQGDHLLCVSNVPPGARGAVEVGPCNSADRRQLWVAQSTVVPGLVTTLVNHLTGLCLDAYASGYVGAYACHGRPNQRWRL